MAPAQRRRKKAGRPRGSITVPGSKTIGFCLQPRQLGVLDAWARERGLKTRSAAARDILDQLGGSA